MGLTPMNSLGYRALLLALLPPGAAWSRSPDSLLGKLLMAWADDFARIEARAFDVLREMDPATADELLSDWERFLGLPDACSALADTVQARQVVADQKYVAVGGQSRDFYIQVAARLGYEIVIHEFDPTPPDLPIDIDISDGRWRFVWRVEILTAVDYSAFRVGYSAVGDRLIEGGAGDLECVINRLKPAHTHVLFTYPEE